MNEPENEKPGEVEVVTPEAPAPEEGNFFDAMIAIASFFAPSEKPAVAPVVAPPAEVAPVVEDVDPSVRRFALMEIC